MTTQSINRDKAAIQRRIDQAKARFDKTGDQKDYDKLRVLRILFAGLAKNYRKVNR